MAVVEAVEGSAEDHGAVSWGCSLLSSWRWRRSGQGGAVVRGSDHFLSFFSPKEEEGRTASAVALSVDGGPRLTHVQLRMDDEILTHAQIDSCPRSPLRISKN
jgi:hypothetical protein